MKTKGSSIPLTGGFFREGVVSTHRTLADNHHRPIGIRLTIISISFIVISLMFTGQSSAKIELETCVGMWLLDEGSGTTAKDSSENKNDGTLQACLKRR